MEMIEANWLIWGAAVLLVLAVAWLLLARARKAPPRREYKPDVLDQGAASVQRNQALIDAAPAAQVIPPAFGGAMAGVAEAVAIGAQDVVEEVQAATPPPPPEVPSPQPDQPEVEPAPAVPEIEPAPPVPEPIPAPPPEVTPPPQETAAPAAQPAPQMPAPEPAPAEPKGGSQPAPILKPEPTPEPALELGALNLHRSPPRWGGVGGGGSNLAQYPHPNPSPTGKGFGDSDIAHDALSQPENPGGGAGVDDLSKIKGLGPKLQALLPTLGLNTYAQIAALSDADLADLDGKLGAFAGRPAKDSWVQQARFLAAGDVAGFEAQFGKV